MEGGHAVVVDRQIEGAGARTETPADVQRTDRENSKIHTATHDTLSTNEQLNESYPGFFI
jgi:hypothetical protein